MKSNNFSSSLSELIKSANLTPTPESVGTVVSYGDGVLDVRGLEEVQAGELVDLGQGTFGLALNLKTDGVGIVVLGDAEHVTTGMTVKRTGRVLSIGVADEVVGRTLDPLGRTLDGRAQLSVKKYMPLERVAPGVMSRQSVTQPLQTGIKAVDAMIPIGRGQRELIIGDRATGKTAIALGTILNQVGQDMICIYVSIGQKRAALAQITQLLQARKAMDYTTIIAATASDSAALQF